MRAAAAAHRVQTSHLVRKIVHRKALQARPSLLVPMPKVIARITKALRPTTGLPVIQAHGRQAVQ